MAKIANRTQRANRLFEANQEAILAAIAERACTPERRQNALAWTWQFLLDGMTIAQAVRRACCKRVTFGRPKRSGQQSDALDHASAIGFADPAAAVDNDTKPTWTIDQMPPRLQLVALPLANGLNRTQTAELCKCSTETIRQRTDEIAAWILDRQPIGRRRVA